MGPTGSNKEIVDLARSLEDDGCTVHTFDSMPVEVTMTKFDMAILVVTEHDPMSLESTDHRIQRILHAAGFLEARLAPDRVCLLVEDAVNELHAPPVTQIRYPTGDPMSGKGELIKFIQAQYPRVQRDLHRQVPIREQAQSDELRVPWAMLIAVALAALIPIVLLARSLGGDDDTETLAGVSRSLDSGQVAGPVADQDSQLGAAGADSGAENDGNGLDAGAAGAGDSDAAQLGESEGTSTDSGTADDGSSVQGSGGDDGSAQTSSSTTSGPANLPSTCVIDVRRSLVLPEGINCTNGGQLVAEGFEGPWHNELGQVALSDGATGSLFYERGEVLPLQTGNIPLDPDAAAYGVNTIEVTFSGEAQHLHLVQDPSRGPNTATLTFTFG